MSDRMPRVNSILREVLAEEIERMNDERLEMVSITSVDTSPNLRTAVVYVDALSGDKLPEAIAALNRAARRLQSAVGSQVRMKYTPKLEFSVDPGVVGGQKIEQILRDLKEEE